MRLAPCGEGRGRDGADVRRMVPAAPWGPQLMGGRGAWSVAFCGEAEGSPFLPREAEPVRGRLAALVPSSPCCGWPPAGRLFWPPYRACGSSRSLGWALLPA